MNSTRIHSLTASNVALAKKTHVQRIACPLSASSRRNVTTAQADCESRPEVGSSRKSSNFGYVASSSDKHDMGTMFEDHTLAASSTPMVVRFLYSAPSEPTMASAWPSKPHIFRHLSTLFTTDVIRSNLDMDRGDILGFVLSHRN